MRLAHFTTLVFAAAMLCGCSSVQYVKSELSGTAKPEGGIAETVGPVKTYGASQEAIRRATLAVLEEQGYVFDENVVAGTIKTDPKPLGDVAKFRFTGATYYAKLAIKIEGSNVTYRAKFDKKSNLMQPETNVDFPEKENELRRDFFLALDKKLSRTGQSVQTIAQQSASTRAKEAPKSDTREVEAQQATPKAMAQPAESNRAARDRIAEAQRLLNKHGYNVGGADGIAGIRTTTAVRQFQELCGLRVSGQLDEETMGALRK